MKAVFKSLALLSVLGTTLPARASATAAAAAAATNDTQVGRQLQRSGQFCTVSASVKCTIDGTNDKDCADIGFQPFGTCGKRAFTYTYEYCNLGDKNVNPVRTAPQSGEIGTEATFRQQNDFPAILLGTLGPGVCRQAYVYEETDTCKKRVIASLRLEGWVEGRVDEPGYYCYAYDFMDITFLNGDPAVDPPTPSPVKNVPAQISLNLKCTYTQNGRTYDCESPDFAQLQGLTSCTVGVTYTYTIVNRSSGELRLGALLNSKHVNLANNEELDPFSEIVITKQRDVNVCDLGGTTIESTAYALASPVSGGIAATAMDSIMITIPNPPLDIGLEGLFCEIDDGTGMDCNAYLQAISSPNQCLVDIKFLFTISNNGIGCVDIKNAVATIGPHTSTIAPFDDVYSCDSRRICRGAVWSIPVRKGAVNICSFSSIMNPWPVELEINDTQSRSQLLMSQYYWHVVNIPPTPVSITSSPVSHPVSGPSKGKSKNKRKLRKLN